MRDLAFYKRKWFIPVIYLAITAIWYLAMTSALKGMEKIGGGDPIVNVVIHNMPYMLLYIGKILLPFNLNVMPGVDTMAIVLGCLSILGLAYIILKIKDIRKLLFCLFWFFIFLAPTLLVPELPAYEHRDYLPLIGLIVGFRRQDFLRISVLKQESSLYTCWSNSCIHHHCIHKASCLCKPFHLLDRWYRGNAFCCFSRCKCGTIVPGYVRQ